MRAPAAERQKAEGVLAATGERAFGALPNSVQQAINGHRTILIAPDFRGHQDIVPFELMHDGAGYLGASRILARFTSLAHMATTLDTRVPLPRRRRALVTAAPVVEGYDALDLALLEQEEITATLKRCGFDAPAIDPERLSASYFTDRLSYVDVLHVSAHGESGADMEWLLLPKHQRLVVDDLMQHRYYSVPFVYLNTCNLGQTRYLGAGMSRGLAYSFAELGAPAVLAHTTPVPDSAALRLAVAFYDNVADRGVGEALLAARRALLEDGESPTSWASAILIGDPEHRIAGERVREVSDLASELLDAYMAPVNEDHRRIAAWTAASNAILEGKNPRIEAALSVVQTMSEVRDLNNPEQAAALDGAIGVADMLHHLPSRAMLRFVKADQTADEGLGAASIEDAIRYLVPLAAIEPAWDHVLLAARKKLAGAQLKARGFGIRTRLPEGQQDDGSMHEIMEAIMGAQLEAEEIYGAAAIRDVEAGIEDILWNAVVAGHPNRFEDIPESVAYSLQVARKLERRGFLPACAMPYAPSMLAAGLRHLWDSQNLNYLSPDFAEGQAGAVHALVEDIAANWAPPVSKSWYVLVEPVPRLIEEVLAFIHGLSWENIYKHLDSRMEVLSEQLKEILDKVNASHPTALAACAAYVSGVVMVKNTFSPLEGSVPESIGERMTKVFHALDADNESRYFSYLSKGFEKVANRAPDELARWRMESAKPPAQPARKRLAKIAAKSSRTRKSR